MKTRTINKLHIAGRRWFQKSYGNTYHTVTVFVNDEILESEQTYGYGDHFIQTAFELLEKSGYDTKGSSHCTAHLRERLNGTYSVSDVSRERDL